MVSGENRTRKAVTLVPCRLIGPIKNKKLSVILVGRVGQVGLVGHLFAEAGMAVLPVLPVLPVVQTEIGYQSGLRATPALVRGAERVATIMRWTDCL